MIGIVWQEYNNFNMRPSTKAVQFNDILIIGRIYWNGIKKISYEKQWITSEDLSELENDKLVISYPRLVIDLWDYSGQLGIELLKLFEMYSKIKE